MFNRPGGTEIVSKQNTNQSENKQQEASSAFKNIGPSYGQARWNQCANYGKKQQSQAPKANEVSTSLGKVKVIPLNNQVPSGWRALKFEEGKEIAKELHPLLEKWSIICFDKGRLSGEGYNYELQEEYGPEVGEKFIVEE